MECASFGISSKRFANFFQLCYQLRQCLSDHCVDDQIGVRVCSRLPSIHDRYWYLFRHSLPRRCYLDVAMCYNLSQQSHCWYSHRFDKTKRRVYLHIRVEQTARESQHALYGQLHRSILQMQSREDHIPSENICKFPLVSLYSHCRTYLH